MIKGKGLNPDFYEILEAGMGDDEDDIRRAYERIKHIYADDSLATYGLYSEKELKELREQLEQAFRILIDPENRRDYDRKLIAEPVKRKKQRQIRILSREGGDSILRTPFRLNRVGSQPVDEQSPTPSSGTGSEPSPDQGGPPAKPRKEARVPIHVPEDTVFTGSLLRKLRKEAGIDLRDISETTKVSIMNLRFLEEENWQKLPALVYLKGFIDQYSQHLGLDSARVVTDLTKRCLEAKKTS